MRFEREIQANMSAYMRDLTWDRSEGHNQGELCFLEVVFSGCVCFTGLFQ